MDNVFSLSDARAVLLPPVHFRVWSSTSQPSNLCDLFLTNAKSTPYRSAVTCAACLEMLT